MGCLAAMHPDGSPGVLARRRISVGFTGRLDNRGELAQTLGLRSGEPPVEIIAGSYERWGASAVGRFEGEFSLIIWDSTTRVMLIARDWFGTRALYYAVTSDGLLVASDPESILAAGLRPIIEDEAVRGYLNWRVRGGNSSFFRNIPQVPPGHYVRLSQSGCEVADYRAITFSAKKTKDESYEACRTAFVRAVRRRIDHSGATVLHISGGLDSSSIASIAASLISARGGPRGRLLLAGAVHPSLACDESELMRYVADVLRLPLETWDGSAARADELVDVPLAVPGGRYWMTGGTQGDIDIAIREGASTIVSGIGGDQIGRPDGLIEDSIRERRFCDFTRYLMHAPNASGRSVLQTLWQTTKSFAPEVLKDAYYALRSAEVRPVPPEVGDAERALRAGGSEVAVRRWLQLNHPQMGMLLSQIQQQAVRTGIETTYPFLDVGYVQAVLQVPPAQWPPPWPQERLHREVLREYLPPRVYSCRTKADFSDALAVRLKVQMASIRELFADKHWRSGRYVDQGAAQHLLAEFDQRESRLRRHFPLTYRVWAIATIECWLRAVFEYAPRHTSEETYEPAVEPGSE